MEFLMESIQITIFTALWNIYLTGYLAWKLYKQRNLKNNHKITLNIKEKKYKEEILLLETDIVLHNDTIRTQETSIKALNRLIGRYTIAIEDNGRTISEQRQELMAQDEIITNMDTEIKELKNTNRAYKGANTKHKETIEGYKLWNTIQAGRIKELKGDQKFWLNKATDWEINNNELKSILQEAKIAINAVAVEGNKKKRLADADKFTFED